VVIVSWMLLWLGFALFVAGLWMAWSPLVAGMVLTGCGLMIVGAVKDDGAAR
jgi:hypothetical protein